MFFQISDPNGIIPISLDDDLRNSGYQVGRSHDLPSDKGTDTVLLLGGGSDLSERVERSRSVGGDLFIITVRSEQDSRVAAEILNLGADDDLVCPFSTRELIARVNAARRTHARDREDGVVVFGITVFRDDRVPEVSGKPIPLSLPEGRVLSRLLRSAGRTVTREALYQALYAYSEQAPSERVIDVHLSHVRRKLRETLGDAAPQIVSVRGVGYRTTPP